MTIQAIAPVEALSAALPAAATLGPVAAPGTAVASRVGADFGAWLENRVGEANDKLLQADRLVQKLALGEADNLHQVMMALDEAKLSFNLLVQVRNKLLDAYSDVMRMQV